MSVLKRTVDFWDIKERDWQKDIEILKVSHTHTATWIQRLQGDTVNMNQEYKQFKDYINQKNNEIISESSSMKRQWDRHMEGLTSR